MQFAAVGGFFVKTMCRESPAHGRKARHGVVLNLQSYFPSSNLERLERCL